MQLRSSLGPNHSALGNLSQVNRTIFRRQCDGWQILKHAFLVALVLTKAAVVEPSKTTSHLSVSLCARVRCAIASQIRQPITLLPRALASVSAD
jgi:hypothetical protein